MTGECKRWWFAGWKNVCNGVKVVVERVEWDDRWAMSFGEWSVWRGTRQRLKSCVVSKVMWMMKNVF